MDFSGSTKDNSCQSQRMWLKFHPHWKRKSPATVVLWQEMVQGHLIGSKEIPQVGFKVQDLIINSPLYAFSCKLITRICC